MEWRGSLAVLLSIFVSTLNFPISESLVKSGEYALVPVMLVLGGGFYEQVSCRPEAKMRTKRRALSYPSVHGSSLLNSRLYGQDGRRIKRSIDESEVLGKQRNVEREARRGSYLTRSDRGGVAEMVGGLVGNVGKFLGLRAGGGSLWRSRTSGTGLPSNGKDGFGSTSNGEEIDRGGKRDSLPLGIANRSEERNGLSVISGLRSGGMSFIGRLMGEGGVGKLIAGGGKATGGSRTREPSSNVESSFRGRFRMRAKPLSSRGSVSGDGRREGGREFGEQGRGREGIGEGRSSAAGERERDIGVNAYKQPGRDTGRKVHDDKGAGTGVIGSGGTGRADTTIGGGRGISAVIGVGGRAGALGERGTVSRDRATRFRNYLKGIGSNELDSEGAGRDAKRRFISESRREKIGIDISRGASGAVRGGTVGIVSKVSGMGVSARGRGSTGRNRKEGNGRGEKAGDGSIEERGGEFGSRIGGGVVNNIGNDGRSGVLGGGHRDYSIGVGTQRGGSYGGSGRASNIRSGAGRVGAEHDKRSGGAKHGKGEHNTNTGKASGAARGERTHIRGAAGVLRVGGADNHDRLTRLGGPVRGTDSIKQKEGGTVNSGVGENIANGIGTDAIGKEQRAEPSWAGSAIRDKILSGKPESAIGNGERELGRISSRNKESAERIRSRENTVGFGGSERGMGTKSTGETRGLTLGETSTSLRGVSTNMVGRAAGLGSLGSTARGVLRKFSTSERGKEGIDSEGRSRSEEKVNVSKGKVEYIGRFSDSRGRQGSAAQYGGAQMGRERKVVGDNVNSRSTPGSSTPRRESKAGRQQLPGSINVQNNNLESELLSHTGRPSTLPGSMSKKISGTGKANVSGRPRAGTSASPKRLTSGMSPTSEKTIFPESSGTSIGGITRNAGSSGGLSLTKRMPESSARGSETEASSQDGKRRLGIETAGKALQSLTGKADVATRQRGIDETTGRALHLNRATTTGFSRTTEGVHDKSGPQGALRPLTTKEKTQRRGDTNKETKDRRRGGIFGGRKEGELGGLQAKQEKDTGRFDKLRRGFGAPGTLFGGALEEGVTQGARSGVTRGPRKEMIVCELGEMQGVGTGAQIGGREAPGVAEPAGDVVHFPIGNERFLATPWDKGGHPGKREFSRVVHHLGAATEDGMTPVRHPELGAELSLGREHRQPEFHIGHEGFPVN